MNATATTMAYQPSAGAMRAAAPAMQSYDTGSQDEYGVGVSDNLEPYAPPYALAELVAMFEDAEEASRTARAASERCRDYYDNKQLTKAETAALAERGQPEIIRNQIKGKVNFYLGFEAKNRSDPRAESEHGTSEGDASDATDMLRFQERRGDFDQKFSDCWENMLIEGYAGIEVLGPSKKDPRVIDIKRWRWDRLFYDPASAEHDFSDASYMGGVVWLDVKQAKRKFATAKGLSAISGSAGQSNSVQETYDDKPRNSWSSGSGNRVRVRIVQMYYECEGEWHWAILTLGGIIEAGPVEITDEQGNSVCPMILQALYVDRDNNRYGEVAEFLSTQDEINKRASKALHLANSSLTVGEQGAGLDINMIKAQKARPDGHIEVPPGSFDKFKFIEHDAAVRQHREMMMDAQMAIEKRGPNASLMGTQSNAPSGRAIRANQEGGMIEGARPRDRYNNLKSRVYRAVWQRVRQFTQAETWISVTSDDKTVRHVGFNKPQTARERLVEDARKDGLEDNEIGQAMQELGDDPRLDEVVGTVKVPMEMDLNVIIEVATESVTMAAEAFEMIAQRPDVPLEMLLEFWPGSARQKKKMRDWMKERQAADSQRQKMEMEMTHESIKADIEVKRARALKDMSQVDAGMPAGAVLPAGGGMPAGALPPDAQGSPYGAAAGP